MRSLLPLLLAALLVSPPTSAAESPAELCARLAAHEYEDGRPPGVAIEDIDIAAALPACRAARAAEPESMAAIYRLGRVLQAAGTYTESTMLYGEAAAGGYAMGQVAYSRALLQGRGVPQDAVASFRWMKQAADQGHPVGMMDAAQKYEHGVGVEHDLDKAIELLQAAAALGEAEAERRLGDFARFDEYGRVDMPAAIVHYRRATELGSSVAEADLGRLHLCECEVRDVEAALRHLESAAAKDEPTALVSLGFEYMHGGIVGRDDTKALDFFTKAAAKGDATGSFYVGLYFEQGRGVDRDLSEAEAWWRPAAMAGYPQAQHALGRLYLQNPGPPARVNDGVIWLERAAAAGIGDAYWDLFAYFSSIPVNDLNRAFEYGQMASYSPDPQVAEYGRSMMKTVLRLKQERGLEPTPPPAESGHG